MDRIILLAELAAALIAAACCSSCADTAGELEWNRANSHFVQSIAERRALRDQP